MLHTWGLAVPTDVTHHLCIYTIAPIALQLEYIISFTNNKDIIIA